jgi:hypothetical protein
VYKRDVGPAGPGELHHTIVQKSQKFRITHKVEGRAPPSVQHERGVVQSPILRNRARVTINHPGLRVGDGIRSHTVMQLFESQQQPTQRKEALSRTGVLSLVRTALKSSVRSA